MDETLLASIEEHFRSIFPPATFTRVHVLGYGDDPDVEPGETAIRAFVDRAGHPARGFEDDERVLRAFEQDHRQKTKKLDQAGLLVSVAWVQFIPDTPARRAERGALSGFPSMIRGLRSDAADEVAGSASVQATLGPADLAIVDALIAAGIGSSRAEIMRWAIDRLRETPAFTRIQEQAPDSTR